MFTRGQAIDFLQKVFGRGVQSNGGQNYSVVCPNCNKNQSGSKRKLVIRTDNFLCHCWVCGYKSRNIADLLKRHHSEWLLEYLRVFVGKKVIPPEDQQAATATEETLKMPSSFITFMEAIMANEGPSVFESENYAYLLRRFDGNRKEASMAAIYWGLGFTLNNTDFQNRLIMPSFDGEGQLNYFTARAVMPSMFPKYKNPNVPREEIVFNELNISWTDPLTIVEGPLDLVKCNQNATCLLGSDLTTEYLLFLRLVQHNTPVVLALDPDAKAKALKIADSLHGYGIQVKMVDIPDRFKDVGEMPREEFNRVLESATLYDKSYSLRSRVAGLVKAG